MRIDGGLADRRRHAIDELLRGGMLETLGLIVDAIPCVAQRACEIGFDDAMPAEHARRRFAQPGG